MKEEFGNVVVFPAAGPHRLGTGGVSSVEIKHTHPKHSSEEARMESLKDVRRTCAALIAAQRQKNARRQDRSA